MLIFFAAFFTQPVLSQINTKKLDYIFLKNGDTIATRIARVTNKKVFYFKTPYTFEIKNISKDEIKTYEFNDDFFQTNSIGNLAHTEIVNVDGYRKDEIYRAIKDWIIVNSKSHYGNIRLQDQEHFILLGTINTPEYFKNDFITAMSVLNDQSVVQTYSLQYDLIIRIKDNKFKIYISGFSIDGKITDADKLLKSIYKKRYARDGGQTINAEEIMRLKKMITQQIQNITNHCKLIRKEDEFHKQVVKYSLMDDDW